MSKKLSLPLTNQFTTIQRQISPDGIITAIKQDLPSGLEIMLAVKIPPVVKKADLKPYLHELNKLNISQKNMSTITGVSQSYISKLLHK